MRKNALLTGLIPMVAVLLLTVLAYAHSLTVSRMYDQRMREDIQACAQQLSQSGAPTAQVQAVQNVLNGVNHHTLSFVSSEVGSLTCTVGFMGIIIASAFLGLVTRKLDESSRN